MTQSTSSDIMHGSDEDTVTAKASRAARGLKEAGMDALSDAKSKVSDAVSGVASQAGEHIDSTKNQIADKGERMAETLREVSSQSEENAIQSRVLETMASGLSSVTETLRNADGTQMISSVQRFAQRNPVLFATGAAVAGLLIARALAGGSSRHDNGGQSASFKRGQDDAQRGGQFGGQYGSETGGQSGMGQGAASSTMHGTSAMSETLP